MIITITQLWQKANSANYSLFCNYNVLSSGQLTFSMVITFYGLSAVRKCWTEMLSTEPINRALLELNDISHDDISVFAKR